MRKKLVAGNWKMNKSLSTTKVLINEIKEKLTKQELEKVDVIICPPFTFIGLANDILNSNGIKIGAQNVFYKDEGAYTGEISSPMLKSLNCEYVILGHSERRQYFNETNHLINLKVINTIQNDLNVILCVGETLEEREKNIHKRIVDEQVTLCLKNIPKEDILSKVIVAYEPIWAIGTGKTATPEQANEMHIEIRHSLENLFGKEIANKIRILYGGSVNEKNSGELFTQSDIDGGLIGGASLKSDNFVAIVKSAI
jgi:triosephosphate isomerase (TIM)